MANTHLSKRGDIFSKKFQVMQIKVMPGINAKS
jgi:hypothetical protein